jgi:SAM-dependent methyltransferase
MDETYVHGHSPREHQRLQDQASTLSELLHSDTVFPSGSHVLEAGCGVGAQTVTLAERNRDVAFTSIDISETSVSKARQRVHLAGLTNVEFLRADLFDLPFEPEVFDHVFVCFVLEHLADPVDALGHLKRVLRPGGTITVVEGDHGSAYFHPDSTAARQAIQCQIALQARAGGNALIGRQLYPLLLRAGYTRVAVSPRMVYVDATRPAFVEGFTRRTFTAMIEGIREQAIREGLLDAATFDQGVRDLYRSAETDGTFCYTFFKATARR